MAETVPAIRGCCESGPLPFRDTDVAFRARDDLITLKLTLSPLRYATVSRAFTVLKGLEEKSPRWVQSWKREAGFLHSVFLLLKRAVGTEDAFGRNLWSQIQK